jgi:hypothetical protein
MTIKLYESLVKETECQTKIKKGMTVRNDNEKEGNIIEGQAPYCHMPYNLTSC